MIIPRGTTPSVQYVFNTVNVSEIVVAYLTIEQNGTLITEKDLTTADVGEKTLTWKLTQVETLKIKDKIPIRVQVRYKLSDGSAFDSLITTCSPYEILKEGVI